MTLLAVRAAAPFTLSRVMFGWHITGRWKGGGKSMSEGFLLLTHTDQREEAIGRGLEHLTGQAVRVLGVVAAAGVAVELTEEPERVEDPIIGLVERAYG